MKKETAANSTPAPKSKPASKPGAAQAIDAETLARTAEISRLKLSDAEAEKFGKDLNLILDYLSTISEVQGAGEGELYYVKNQNTVLRKDEPKAFDNTAGIRSQFAKKKDSGEMLSPKSM
jgi:aspartyl/glutamyl-tRNA(Asn/Gln) amidotransferase C subunit